MALVYCVLAATIFIAVCLGMAIADNDTGWAVTFCVILAWDVFALIINIKKVQHDNP